MLVLTRRPLESIKVGDAVVTVLAVDRNKVRIGIKAPDDVLILRTELKPRKLQGSEINGGLK